MKQRISISVVEIREKIYEISYVNRLRSNENNKKKFANEKISKNISTHELIMKKLARKLLRTIIYVSAYTSTLFRTTIALM